MDVFNAFPNAVVKNTWQLCQIQRGTEIGNIVTAINFCDVIVDEENTAYTEQSPVADGIQTNTLLFVRPEQLPTMNINELLASYCWQNADYGQYYAIENVGVGKNQHTGSIEHVEFIIRPMDGLNGD